VPEHAVADLLELRHDPDPRVAADAEPGRRTVGELADDPLRPGAVIRGRDHHDDVLVLLELGVDRARHQRAGL